MLRTFSTENLKCFPAPTSIELAPITLLLGRNNSGKSALARLPYVLARSLGAEDGPALLLEGDDLDYAASLLDLAHNRSQRPVKWAVQFLDGLEVAAAIVEDSATHLQIVEYLSIKDGANTIEWKLVSRPDAIGRATYRVTGAGEVTLMFAAGLPIEAASPVSTREVIAKARTAFRSLKHRTWYLGPMREEPRRYYRTPQSPPRFVGPHGENAAEILALASALGARESELTKDISKWFFDQTGYRLAIESEGRGTHFSVALERGDPVEGAFSVNLADSGQGLGQIFPLVVQAFFSSQVAERSAFCILEQPELHLHPAAHGAIADIILTLQRTNAQSRIIIETHSENLLLRFRRRIAERSGGLEPAHVVAYWLTPEGDGMKPRPIRFLADGTLSDWPEGVFAEDYEEILAIRKTLAERRGG
jgi:predicted ATPase